MDNLMRNPYQAAPPASKPILRRRARSQPHSSKNSPSPERREGDQARRGWNEGLKDFIARQRQEKAIPKVGLNDMHLGLSPTLAPFFKEFEILFFLVRNSQLLS
jgi:hypothetical protein